MKTPKKTQKKPEIKKCKATTLKGKPCKSNALAGTDFCKRHDSEPNDKLTGKQEQFAYLYVFEADFNATEAYRLLNPDSEANESTINRNAYNLVHNDKIATRIEEFKNQAREMCLWTYEQQAEKLKSMVDLYEVLNPPAAIAAIKQLSKQFGHDEPQKVDHTSSDGSMTPVTLNVVGGRGKGEDSE